MNVISKSILAVAGAAALTLSTLPVLASAGEVQNRVNHEQARINQGVSSGQLTQHEYNADESRLHRIENQRNRDLRRQDGHLTAREKSQLNRELNHNSNDIYFTKHNRADQPGV